MVTVHLRRRYGRRRAAGHAGNAVESFERAEVAHAPPPDVAAPSLTIASSPAAGDTNGLDDTIRVTMNFSEAVTVDTVDGTPTLVGDMAPAAAWREAGPPR